MCLGVATTGVTRGASPSNGLGPFGGWSGGGELRGGGGGGRGGGRGVLLP